MEHSAQFYLDLAVKFITFQLSKEEVRKMLKDDTEYFYWMNTYVLPLIYINNLMDEQIEFLKEKNYEMALQLQEQLNNLYKTIVESSKNDIKFTIEGMPSNEAIPIYDNLIIEAEYGNFDYEIINEIEEGMFELIYNGNSDFTAAKSEVNNAIRKIRNGGK